MEQVFRSSRSSLLLFTLVIGCSDPSPAPSELADAGGPADTSSSSDSAPAPTSDAASDATRDDDATDGGGCTNECVSGAKQCGTGGVRSCEIGSNGCTTWSSPVACTGGSVCSSGVCRKVVQLAAGGDHACELLEDGAVLCWGRNYRGALGDGTDTDRRAPVFVKGIASAGSIAVGDVHSCAVLAAGSVRCWGDNVNGQLGDGTTTSSLTPVTVKGVSGVRSLSAGGSATCETDGDPALVSCWGSRALWGDGSSADVLSPKPLMSSITLDAKPLGVAMGSAHVCVMLASGKVQCSGNNGRGQLGVGVAGPSRGLGYVTGITASLELAAGRSHTCAAIGSATAGAWTVSCWGYNDKGQLGDGTTTDAPAPTAVAGIAGARALAAGDEHTCVVLDTGAVKCWGANDAGQLATGSGLDSKFPVDVVGLGPARTVVAGATFNCALLQDGTVWCWGENTSGQLGADSKASMSRVPMKVAQP